MVRGARVFTSVGLHTLIQVFPWTNISRGECPNQDLVALRFSTRLSASSAATGGSSCRCRSWVRGSGAPARGDSTATRPCSGTAKNRRHLATSTETSGRPHLGPVPPSRAVNEGEGFLSLWLDAQARHASFRYVACFLDALPAADYLDSDNLVARLNLPNMHRTGLTRCCAMRRPSGGC